MNTLKENLSLLLADDEENFLFSFRFSLEKAGFETIHTAMNESEIFHCLERYPVHILFLDLNMPGRDGLDLLPIIRQNYPDIQIIILTAVDNTDTAVRCIKEGAYDYIVKPVNRNRLLLTLEKVVEHLQIKQDMSNLQEAYFAGELKREESFEEILTRSPKMYSIFRYVEAICQSPQPVLVTGETGVGKELMARAIYKSGALNGPFVSVNIAGLDDTTFNDSLFGHRKGAFTGADRDREGLLKKAENGAVLLDEIGELNDNSQIKLLRLLNDGSYYPLGSDKLEHAKVRFILATNRNLEELVKKGKFRKDLFYRLISHHIHIPPLRERKEDIAYIVREVMKDAQKILQKTVYLTGQAMIQFSSYNYPGNIRELKNIVFDCIANTRDGETINIEYLETRLAGTPFSETSKHRGDRDLTVSSMTLADAELALIRTALSRAGGNQSRAAEQLGISRQALNKKIKRHPEILEGLS